MSPETSPSPGCEATRQPCPAPGGLLPRPTRITREEEAPKWLWGKQEHGVTLADQAFIVKRIPLHWQWGECSQAGSFPAQVI